MNLKIVRWIDIYVGVTLSYLIFCFKKIFKIIGGGNKIKDEPPDKILLVKFWGVGNVCMLLPAAAALKKRYPRSRIDFLTLPYNKDIAGSSGLFDNVYSIFNVSLGMFIITSVRALKMLKKMNYDLVIDFEQFARFSAIFSSLIGRKKTIGFNTDRQHRGFLYTDSVVYNNHIHITRSFYSLVECAGAEHKNSIEAVTLLPRPKDVDETAIILTEAGVSKEDITVILHPGTSQNFELRRWPAEYFTELADKLIDNFGVKTVFTGVSEEVNLINGIVGGMKNREKAINLSGRLNFNQFICLIKLSDLLISADTAPVHLASCFSVPVLGLYGPNTPLLYGPWGKENTWIYKSLSCSPCITNYNAKVNKCGHPEGKGACMKKISVDEVFLKIKNNYFDRDAPCRLKKLKK